MPDLAALSFEERLALLLEREQAVREDRRLTRLLQLARLREAACVEDLNFRVARGLDRGLVLRLAEGAWVRRHEVVLLTGPTGSGKTWIACALGHQACRQGHRVRYLRLPRLLGEDLVKARADGSYGRLFQQLACADLLILDDWGLAPLGDRERRDLLELVEDRVGRRATLVTSQLPVEHWQPRAQPADRQRHLRRCDPRPAGAPRPPDHADRRLAPSTRAGWAGAEGRDEAREVRQARRVVLTRSSPRPRGARAGPHALIGIERND